MFKILVQTKAGETFTAFHWTRSAATGIAQAERDLVKHGVEWITIYAVPCADREAV